MDFKNEFKNDYGTLILNDKKIKYLLRQKIRISVAYELSREPVLKSVKEDIANKIAVIEEENNQIIKHLAHLTSMNI